jgi:hypothetical protein
MMRTTFLAALFLCLWGAAYAAAPSANLSVQVTRATTGNPLPAGTYPFYSNSNNQLSYAGCLGFLLCMSSIPTDTFIWSGTTLSVNGYSNTGFADNGTGQVYNGTTGSAGTVQATGFPATADPFAILSAPGGGYTIQDLRTGNYLNVSAAGTGQLVFNNTSTPTVWNGPTLANACSPTGQAAADAAAAGFTTTALCNDFTMAIPNTVGTGLPANWINCNFDTTPAVWYVENNPQNTSGPPGATACSDVHPNTTDPTYGNLALDLQITAADITNFNTNGTKYPNLMLTTIDSAQSISTGQYPNGYFEFTGRSNPKQSNAHLQGVNHTHWSWVAPAQKGSGGLIELDNFETFQVEGDMGVNVWSSTCNGGGGCNPYLWSAPSTENEGIYHTWGTLFTGNGLGGYSACNYYDGTREGCYKSTYPSDVLNYAKRYLILQAAPQCNYQVGNDSCTAAINYDFFIKNVKELSCPNWQVAGAAGMCNGTTLNSMGFYQ